MPKLSDIKYKRINNKEYFSNIYEENEQNNALEDDEKKLRDEIVNQINSFSNRNIKSNDKQKYSDNKLQEDEKINKIKELEYKVNCLTKQLEECNNRSTKENYNNNAFYLIISILSLIICTLAYLKFRN